jgi:hypothetical protein
MSRLRCAVLGLARLSRLSRLRCAVLGLARLSRLRNAVLRLLAGLRSAELRSLRLAGHCLLRSAELVRLARLRLPAVGTRAPGEPRLASRGVGRTRRALSLVAEGGYRPLRGGRRTRLRGRRPFGL